MIDTSPFPLKSGYETTVLTPTTSSPRLPETSSAALTPFKTEQGKADQKQRKELGSNEDRTHDPWFTRPVL